MAADGSLSDCLKAQASELARLNNNALFKMLQKLETKLKGFKYSIFDFHSALAEVMKFPSKYGMSLFYNIRKFKSTFHWRKEK